MTKKNWSVLQSVFSTRFSGRSTYSRSVYANFWQSIGLKIQPKWLLSGAWFCALNSPKIACRPGSTRTRWRCCGSLQRSPTLNWIMGEGRGKGVEGWDGEKGEGNGRGRERKGKKRERVGEERGGKRYPAYVPTPTCTHNSPMLCYSLIIQLTVYNRTITRFIADDKVVYQWVRWEIRLASDNSWARHRLKHVSWKSRWIIFLCTLE